MNTIIKARRLLLVTVLLVCGLVQGYAVKGTFSIPLTQTYEPEGSTFSSTLNWNMVRSVSVEMDLSACTAASENVLSMGKDISEWCGKAIHMYYSKANTKQLEIDLVDNSFSGNGYNDWRRYEMTISNPSSVKVVLSKENGLQVVDGDNTTAITSMYNNKSNFDVADLFDKSNFFGMGKMQVGSMGEGNKPSHAVYKSVTVDEINVSTTFPATLPWTDILATGAEAGFMATVNGIDFKKQAIEAVIDLSTCDVSKKDNENILSIGTDIKSWNGGNNLHLYYTPNTGILHIDLCKNGNSTATKYDETLTSNILTVKLASDGLYLNGNLCSNLTSTLTGTLLNQTVLQIGNKQGNNETRSNAFYKSVKVIDTATDVPPTPTSLPISDYSPKGSKFCVETPFNKDQNAIIANIDLTQCTGNKENILSIGSLISEWGTGGDDDTKKGYNLHFYYPFDATGKLGIAYTYRTGQHDTEVYTIPADADLTNFTIEFNKDGIYLDGKLFVTADASKGITASDMLQLASLSTLQVGATQGESLSTAYYHSIALGEYYSRADIDLTLPVADFTPDHDRKFMGKAYNINDHSVFHAKINLSGCQGNDNSNENILSIGNGIEQWNKSGIRNLHFYYTKSNGQLAVDWVDQDNKYSGQPTSSSDGVTGTKQNNGAFEWYTTLSGDDLDVEISYNGGLKINGVTADDNDGWLANAIKTRLYTVSPLQVGSKQGNPSHATYANIAVEQTFESQVPGTLPAEWFEATKASEGKFVFEAGKLSDNEGNNKSIIAEIDLTRSTVANENVLSIGTAIANWSANGQYNLHFYYDKSRNRLQYSFTEYVGAKEQAITGYVGSMPSQLVVKVSKDNGLEINGEKVQNTALDARIRAGLYNSAKPIYIGSQEGNVRSQAVYKSIRLVDAEGIKVFNGVDNWNAYEMTEYGKFAVNNVEVNFNEQKIKADIDLSSCGEDSDRNLTLLSIGKDITTWSTDEGNFNLHIYYVPRTKKLVVDAVDKSGYLGSGDSKVEYTYDVTSTNLGIELSAHGLNITGADIDNLPKYVKPNQLFTARLYKNLLRQSKVQLGSAQGFYSNAIYKSIAVEELADEEKIDNIIELPQYNYKPKYDSKYFKSDLNVNFIGKKLVAKLDLSTCGNVANENVLSVGTGIPVWKSDNTYNLHIYYTKKDAASTQAASENDANTAGTLLIEWFKGREAPNAGSPTVSRQIEVPADSIKSTTIELSARGLKVLGNLVEGFSATDMFDLMLSGKNLQLGSLEGEVRSNATYPLLAVLDDEMVFTDLWIYNPAMLGNNKEEAHATYIPYKDVESMRGDTKFYAEPWLKPEKAQVMSLNGPWNFIYLRGEASGPKVDDALHEVGGGKDEEWGTIAVPMSWEMAGHGRPVYTNIGYPFDDNPPIAIKSSSNTNEEDHNANGNYRRTFALPQGWADKRVFVHFDGVYSAAVVWIDGKYVGYSQGANTDAEFDITSALNSDMTNHQIDVRVYRWCDGSYFEGQDMWHLSGIHRDVYLKATPKVFVSDHKITTTGLSADATSATSLDVALTLDNRDKLAGTKRITVTLKDASDNVVGKQEADAVYTADKTSTAVNVSLSGLPSLTPWSAENPYLYTVEVSQAEGGNEEMAFSTKYGFRNITIDNGVLKVNGKRVYIKGVNSHDTNPVTGKALSESDMLNDIQMMKRANINTFRGSHYPRQPKMYAMFDAYGMYVIPSADIECHKHQSLSSDSTWLPTIEDRTERMVRRDINHPSVIVWSLGNECGDGSNFAATYKLCHDLDATRPVHYEGSATNSDFLSFMYPSVNTVKRWSTSSAKPYIMCEYAHAMGQAVGNLKEYWEAIEANDHIAGGCIWDWADQALYDQTKTERTDSHGFHYWMSGYDYNKVQESGGFQGNFLDNGLVTPDRKWTGKLAEVKKVYQNVKMTDWNGRQLTLHNGFLFTNLSKYNLAWRVLRDGRIVEEGVQAAPSVEAGATGYANVQYTTATDDEAEYVIDFELQLKDSTAWARAGYDVAREQFVINPSDEVSNPAVLFDHKASKAAASLALSADGNTVSGTDENGNAFSLTFGADGSLANWTYANKQLIQQGPDFNSMRNIDNDVKLDVVQTNTSAKTLTSGLAADGDNYVLSMGGQATNCGYTIAYTIMPDATVEMAVTFSPKGATRRLGLGMQFAPKFENVEYYGRGPWSNYVDRKTGTYLGRYYTTVDDMIEEQIHPQTYGDHQDLRQLVLTNLTDGVALDITTAGNVAFSLSHYDETEWCGSDGTGRKTLWNDNNHWYGLTPAPQVYAHFDAWQRGLGNNSCNGDQCLDQYLCPTSGILTYTLRFKPQVVK